MLRFPTRAGPVSASVVGDGPGLGAAGPGLGPPADQRPSNSDGAAASSSARNLNRGSDLVLESLRHARPRQAQASIAEAAVDSVPAGPSDRD